MIENFKCRRRASTSIQTVELKYPKPMMIYLFFSKCVWHDNDETTEKKRNEWTNGEI